MKKYILTSLTFLFCLVSISAQQKVFIYLNSGDTIVKDIWEIDSISFAKSGSADVVADTAKAIDLGLSVLWSSFNLGASSEYNSGYLVGWGDISCKNFSSSTKYFPTSNPPSDIIRSDFDVAKHLWGSDWRIPTVKEVVELITKCNWQWDSENKGFRITSNTTNNSIFLPAVGSRYKSTVSEKDSVGYYWTGMLDPSDKLNALCFKVSEQSDSCIVGIDRYMGCAIRPVFGKYKPGVSLDASTVDDITYNSASIHFKIDGDFENTSSYGICYSKTLGELNLNSGFKTECDTLLNFKDTVFTLKGLDVKTTYYYFPYAFYDGKYVYGDTLSFTTATKFPVARIVDLGLSVKWASWNIGAKQVEDYGSFIGWGDPSGELLSFNEADYAQGFDSTSISGTKYDVAHVQWGDKWRMPTTSEVTELRDLNWSFSSNYNGSGVQGWIVKSVKSGINDSIFIPRGGWINAEGPMYYGTQSFYWTSDFESYNNARSCQFYPNDVIIKNSNKTIHMLVRPVYDDRIDSKDTVIVVPETEEGKKVIGVDLGLSVKWADRNIGAENSLSNGDHFAWGELTTKVSYSRENYTMVDSTSFDSTTNVYERAHIDSIFGTKYDVAHVRLSGTWRMPTQDEFIELVSRCKWTLTTVENVKVYKVEGANGNYIYLPFTGYYNIEELVKPNVEGYYWGGTLSTNRIHYNEYGSCLSLSQTNYTVPLGMYREIGLSIRPVKP